MSIKFRIRKEMEFKVHGFRVQGSGFRVQGSGFRVQGCGGGFAASINNGDARRALDSWFPRIVSLPL